MIKYVVIEILYVKIQTSNFIYKNLIFDNLTFYEVI